MRWVAMLVVAAACGDASSASVDAPGSGGDAPPPVACVPGNPPTTGWHVSPTGSGAGDGSLAAPWDLKTALAPAPAIKPGDTVWLHGGMYTGAPFVAKLTGTQAAPITMRSYPGEWAVLDGAGSTDSIFQVYRSYGVYRDFEITDSTPHARAMRQSGTWMEGTGIKLVNLVIHDTGNVAMYEEAPDLELYGSLVYNIGFDDPDPGQRSHGHNLYLQNDTGKKLVSDNIIFNGYSFGIHSYAEGGSHLKNIELAGNVLFGSGAPAPGTDQNKDNLLIGNTSEPATGIVVRDNFGWARPINERSVAFGYGQTNGTLALSGNYFVGTTDFRDPWTLTMQGNMFVGPVTGMVTTSAFPSNTYVSARPAQTAVFSRPNMYEPGRANIVVYNWAGDAQVAFDASALLAPGTPYEVRRAQSYFAAPVASGVYDGSPIAIPITGGAPAQPIGSTGAIDPAEAPGTEFDVFVIRATCAP